MFEVVVVAPSGQAGAVDRSLIPAASAVIEAADLQRTGPASVIGGLADRLGGVVLDEAQGNELQPNLFYRGFEASPLAGDAQGLAVYVGGVRFNQPFGDTVNWDLIPDLAVQRMELLGSNPAFGLNALGGSLAVRLKDAFSWTGAAAEVTGGSFGRGQGGFEYGATNGDTAFYAALQGVRDDGWREHSPSRAGQAYFDLGWKQDRSELHLNLLAADTSLTGNGVSPVQLLTVDRAAVFTYPDETRNRFGRLAVTGAESFGAASLEGAAYFAHLNQETFSGNAADAAPCPRSADVLCMSDGEVLSGPSGGPIANFAAGGPYATLSLTRTVTNSYGASAQLSLARTLLGETNRLLLGASYDGSNTAFAASTRLGALSSTRGFVGPGVEIDQADGSIAPVRVGADSNAFGLYFNDAWELGRHISLTLSGRYNAMDETLSDHLGTALDGRHSYARFDPAAGITWLLPGQITAYAGYAETNRAPTPAELSCASPQAPCSLANFFVADPALKQVTARTVEAGLRGRSSWDGASFSWHTGLYRTEAADDIQFVASPILGRDYFANIGRTRRQGIEAGVSFQSAPWSLYADYAYTDATFRSALTLDGGQNPMADASGLIHVRPGDHIPSIPVHSLKFGADYQLGRAWTVSLTGRYASGQYLSGDAANLNPETKPYLVLNLRAAWRVAPHVEISAWIRNVTDARYATFGAFSPTAQVPIPQALGASNPRSLSPGAPTAGFVSVRMSY